jgi:hypothetical protein
MLRIHPAFLMCVPYGVAPFSRSACVLHASSHNAGNQWPDSQLTILARTIPRAFHYSEAPHASDLAYSPVLRSRDSHIAPERAISHEERAGRSGPLYVTAVQTALSAIPRNRRHRLGLLGCDMSGPAPPVRFLLSQNSTHLVYVNHANHRQSRRKRLYW